MGTAWSEPTLIKLAAGFEAANTPREVPGFIRRFEAGNGSGQLRQIDPSMARLKQQLLQAHQQLPRRPRFL